MNDPVNFLSSVLAILVMWIAFDAGYRSYRINLLRDRISELRSELFEAARKGRFGEAGFSDPVYLHVRRVLNSSIRFAHQMTLSRMLLLWCSSRWWLDSDRIRHTHAELDRALAVRGPAVRNRIRSILRETDFAIVTHMVHVNVIGFALFTLLDVVARGLHAQQAARAYVAQRIVRNRKMLEPLEQDALYDLEQLEHRHATP